MTAKQIEEILRAMIKCRERQVSGKCSCRSPECDECYLCYEQGTMGEIIEALKGALKIIHITRFKMREWSDDSR
jgi:hypothetical protein